MGDPHRTPREARASRGPRPGPGPRRHVMGSGPALAGQTLLVIGGSSGIGLETARLARREGARVIVVARDAQRVQRAGLEIGGSIAAFDATDFKRLSEFFHDLGTELDHVFLAAPSSRRVPLAPFDVEDARRAVEGHLLLPLQLATDSANTVRPGGTLLLTGCSGGRGSAAGPPFAAAITAALSMLTKSLASELAPIRVNMVAAGFVETPADIAALAIHVMTNTAVTGSTFEIDGARRIVAV